MHAGIGISLRPHLSRVYRLAYGVDWKAPSLDDVDAFMELLVQSDFTLGTLKNYLCAIKAFYFDKGWTVVTDLFTYNHWAAMVKGMTLTVRPKQDNRSAMTLQEFELMVKYCGRERGMLPLKVGLVLGFFGYLHLSNLLPLTLHV